MPPARCARKRDRFFEQFAQRAVLVAGEVVAVGLAERPEPLDLDPLPGVVLPHEPAFGEAHALVGREQRAGRPPLAVACEREEERGQARGDEAALCGDLLDVREHRVELGEARAAQALDRSRPRLCIRE